MKQNETPVWVRFIEAALAGQRGTVWQFRDHEPPFGTTTEEWDRLDPGERKVASLGWHLRPNMAIPNFARQPVGKLLAEVPSDVAALWLRLAGVVEESQRYFDGTR